MTEPAASRLLARHFFRRFLENDLLSPSGDAHESVTVALAFLVMAGLWVSAGLVFNSLNPFVSPFGTLLSALNDKFVGLAGSMIVTGLGTVLEWEALGLDRRDWAILGPLPVASRILVLAKLRALTWFVAVFALAVNGVPSLLYPPLQGQALPIGLTGTLWLIVVHVAVCLVACAFGFLGILAIRETLQLVAGPRTFRRISGFVQFIAVLVLTSALLLVVTSRVDVAASLSRGDREVSLVPPMWFVGLYETMIGPVVRPLPAEAPSRKRHFWALIENQRDRSAYLGHGPEFERLAGVAVPSIVILALVCTGAFAINRRRVAPPERSDSVLQRALRRHASRWAIRWLVRHPVSQAGFFFTLQTLARSASHRAYLAGYLAAGLAVVVVTTRTSGPAAELDPGTAPASQLLAIQMILSFFLVTGLRRVFAIPSELGGNWIFRLGWVGDAGRYLAGVRRAVQFGALLPLLMVLAPFHAFLWGARTTALHFVLGWLASLVLTDVVLLNFKKLPFTCSYSPKGTFKTRWPWYLLGFLVSTYGFCSLERLALGSWIGVGVLAGSLCATIVGTALYRRWRPSGHAAVIFDDPPDDPTLRLGLMLAE